MKKIAAVAVSLGVILVIVGLVIVGIVGGDALKDVFTFGFSHNLSKADVRENKSYEGLKEINIKVNSYTVYILPSEDENLSVQYVNPTEDDVSIAVNNDEGVLRIVQEDSNKNNWSFKFNWFNGKRFIAIYVPQSEIFADVSVKFNAEVAGLSVKDLTFHEFNGTAKTGAISFENTNFDELCDARTETGAISIKNMKALGVGAYTDTGAVKINNLTSGSLKAETETGSITLTDSNIGSIYLEVSTGSIVCNANAQSVYAESDTGSIRFDTNASDIRLFADTGSIRGTVRGDKKDYQIKVKKDTGSSNISNQDVASYVKLFIAEVDTGSIEIYFDND